MILNYLKFRRKHEIWDESDGVDGNGKKIQDFPTEFLIKSID